MAGGKGRRVDAVKRGDILEILHGEHGKNDSEWEEDAHSVVPYIHPPRLD